MNINEQLLQKSSRKQAELIRDYIGADPGRFRKLMDLFFISDPVPAMRASWAISLCADHHPELLKPYLGKLIHYLASSENHHPAITRNLSRALQKSPIPVKYQGHLMKICFDLILKPETPVASKVNALSILANLSEIYPEIKNELKMIIDTQWPAEKAAFRTRAKKLKLVLHK